MRSKLLRFLGVPFLLVLSTAGARARAEGGYAAPAAPGAAVVPGSGNSVGGSGRVPVFSDGVFNVDAPPPVSAPAVSSGGRYLGDSVDYTSDQQAKWKSNCAAQRNVDARAYRECYQQEKARTQAQVRASFDRVEREQSGRFRSAAPPSPLDLKTPSRIPSEVLDPDAAIDRESNRDKDKDREDD